VSTARLFNTGRRICKESSPPRFPVARLHRSHATVVCSRLGHVRAGGEPPAVYTGLPYAPLATRSLSAHRVMAASRVAGIDRRRRSRDDVVAEPTVVSGAGVAILYKVGVHRSHDAETPDGLPM